MTDAHFKPFEVSNLSIPLPQDFCVKYKAVGAQIVEINAAHFGGQIIFTVEIDKPINFLRTLNQDESIIKIWIIQEVDKLLKRRNLVSIGSGSAQIMREDNKGWTKLYAFRSK